MVDFHFGASGSANRSNPSRRHLSLTLMLALMTSSGIADRALAAEAAGEAMAAEAPQPEAETGESKKIDLRLYHPESKENWLLPSLRWDQVYFTGFNAWAGNVRTHIGNQSNGWAEYGLVPALDGQYSLGDKGTLHARVSGVYSTTQLGLDWAGSNFSNGETKKPSKFTLEDAYLQWSSGNAIPSLGKDAIELSIGSQKYQVGSGFLFGNAGSDGGNRGGYWIGLRKAFELAGVARLKTGGFTGEAVYLRSDDLHGDHTNSAGANLEYDFAEMLGVERLKLGVGYWNFFESDNLRRDGLNVVSVRLDAAPIATLPGLGIDGEYVKQKNRWLNDSWAFAGRLGYDFGEDEVPWAPYVSYRFAYFTGDEQSSDNDNRFDPLYYTFNDWNEWYIGEIIGEWIAGNSNINASIVRVRVNPTDSLALNLFYIYSRLNEKQGEVTGPGGRPVDPRVVAIGDKDLSHEVDFVADWSVNDYLSASFSTAVLVPESGAKDFFDDDEVWTQFMFYTSVNF